MEKAKRRQSAGIIDLVVCITDREVSSLYEGHYCDLCPHMIECTLVKRIGAPLTIVLATRRTRAFNVALSKKLNEILSISFCPLHFCKSIPRQFVRRKINILHTRTAWNRESCAKRQQMHYIRYRRPRAHYTWPSSRNMIIELINFEAV